MLSGGTVTDLERARVVKMSNGYFAVLGDTKVGGPWESVHDASMRCTLVNAELERIEKEAERRGAERRQSEIVAWLRRIGVVYPNVRLDAALTYADAIERGEFEVK
jgi:hypothetical protein